ncbi:MAG: hypothetical protein EAZ91_20155 [Cytophagales bacterium]|nr:MAG: hypothetical protein EAZ91_20155 [Cytophagales bacterium]
MIDLDEELRVLENSIRDIISFVLLKVYGPQWVDKLKVSEGRLEHWKENYSKEHDRLKGSPLESRLIYYSEFYDLCSIIDKHWDNGFSEVFQDKKPVLVFLKVAEKFRNPDAHSRELFEYQKHLIKGISGELRTQIMKYRGKRENPDDYFPVIEAVIDSLGNSISNPVYAQMIQSSQVCKVGDMVEIIAHSIDPLGGDLDYSIDRIGRKSWAKNNKSTIVFEKSDIGKCCDIQIMIKTKRDHHAYSSFDDYVQIRYVVLPS